MEGWDQPEVEITVIKSMSYDYKPKRPDAAAERLNSIRVVTERKSTAELVISTIPTSRHGNWAPFLRPTATGSVMAEYRIHVPRDSKLVIHHGTGFVSVNAVTGDIEASAGRGDIMLWLRPGSYSIDAKTKLGNVS